MVYGSNSSPAGIAVRSSLTCVVNQYEFIDDAALFNIGVQKVGACSMHLTL